MSYTNTALLPNERLVYLGKIHWIIFFNSLLFWAGVFVVLIGSSGYLDTVEAIDPFDVLISLGVLTIIVSWISAFIKVKTTEYSITDRRVIFKEGLIKRDTREISLSKVESVSLSQGIVGRILNYGNLYISGTGVNFAPIILISDPVRFRTEVFTASENFSRE